MAQVIDDLGAFVRGARPLLHGTPWTLLATMGLALLLAAALSAAGLVSDAVVAVVAVTTGHGALLGTALGWANVPRRAVFTSVGLIAVGAALARADRFGAVGYLGPALWVVRLAVAGRLRPLGLGTPCSTTALVAGGLAGAFLGAHVLISATLTLGYRARLDLDVWAPAVLYDAGLQVIATELFLRGALFNRAQRRWSLGPATSGTLVVTLLRYLVDPLLPRAAEVVLGMVFYVSLLGVAACWLFWRFGTLVPGLIASLLFFAAYRALVAG